MIANEVHKLEAPFFKLDMVEFLVHSSSSTSCSLFNQGLLWLLKMET